LFGEEGACCGKFIVSAVEEFGKIGFGNGLGLPK
jgi:hypothetical protein